MPLFKQFRILLYIWFLPEVLNKIFKELFLFFLHCRILNHFLWFFKGFLGAFFYFFHLDYMVAVHSLHGLAVFSRLQRKCGFFKLRHHLAAGEEPELSPVIFCSRVDRIFLGQFSEISALIQLFNCAVCLFFCFDQDMPDPCLLRNAEFFFVAVVIFLDIFIADFQFLYFPPQQFFRYGLPSEIFDSLFYFLLFVQSPCDTFLV